MVKIYFENNNYSQNKSDYSMPAHWLTHYAWVSCMWTYLDIDFTRAHTGQTIPEKLFFNTWLRTKIWFNFSLTLGVSMLKLSPLR